MFDNTFSELSPMLDGIEPITIEERQGRLAKARRLMAENGLDAIFVEAGSSLFYYTGVRWGLSERVLAAVIPAQGEIAYVCAGFEEERLRESLLFGDDVRVWQEEESPYALTAAILRDRGIATGSVGVEETTRYFVYNGLSQAAPTCEFVSADPVTIPCRAIKSKAEIALMQRASDITSHAYVACINRLREGMSQDEFRANAAAAHKALGVTGHIDAQFGKSTAFPHGSKELTYLQEGDVVLMDGSCTVDGYYSDISRTVVFGEPTLRMRDVWNLEKEAQAAAFQAAQLGAPFEAIDAAARQVITDAGFGPDYQVPGLPHRTGHGLGLDIHEWYNVVRGNTMPLVPGLCFSDEPMIAIYGEFGVRLEDCIYMAEDGPHFFTQPSPSIEQPFDL